MIVLLSSAKTLDGTTPWRAPTPTQPRLLAQAQTLMGQLRARSAADIARLMGVSAKIAQLNAGRFQAWTAQHTPQNAKPALLAYQGDVYKGLAAGTLSDEDIAFAQRTLRIVSGLYGVLRPLDLMQPYRLEMAIKLAGPRWKDLYDFWSPDVTRVIDADAAANGRLIINLASQEYFSVLDTPRLKTPMLTVSFKQERGGKIVMVPILAKRARGLMARHIVTRRVTAPEGLRDFSDGGYRFVAGLSDDHAWVFVRRG